MDSLVDQVLQQRYHIQSKLSQRPGSKTFLATDLTTNDPVVVKLLLFDADFTWENFKLFERETAALKELEHPAIPAYLDFADVEIGDRKGFLLVQAYIEAPSLQDWMKRGRTFSEAELQQLAKDTLDILAYLHHRQPTIIHRDIKPSNLLLSDRSGNRAGQVYLVDFGAIQGPQHGGTMTIVGTYGYMPLEQFGGRAVPASDLYSLGATLVYLATGQHPADLPQQDMRLQFAEQAQLSPSFYHWLQWLLAPNFAQRPASVESALHQFHHPPNQLTSLQPKITRKQRPKSSRITIKRDSASLVLCFPMQQLEKARGDRFARRQFWGELIRPGFFLLFTMPILLLSMLIPWAFIIVLSAVILLFFCGSLGETVSGFSRITSAVSNIVKPAARYSLRLTFHPDNGQLLLQLYSKLSEDEETQRLLHQQRLVGMSAGPYKDSRYRINFICDRLSAYKLHLQGSQQEIQWLQGELSSWTGWDIGYHDSTKSVGSVQQIHN